MIDTLVVEPHPVDERAGLGDSEHARPGIAGLRPRRDRSQFNVTEAQRSQRIQVVSVLVETCREAERVRELKTQAAYRQGGRRLERRPERPAPTKPGPPETVGQFRIQMRENRQRGARDDRCEATPHRWVRGEKPANPATKP